MPFQKGQSGNPAGRSSEKLYAAALRMELAAVGADLKALRAIARAQIAKAIEGDRYATEHVVERTDGKVPQPHGGSDDLPPMQITRIERVIVDPANRDS